MRIALVLVLAAASLSGCISSSPAPTVVTAPRSTATVVCPNGVTVTPPAVCE